MNRINDLYEKIRDLRDRASFDPMSLEGIYSILIGTLEALQQTVVIVERVKKIAKLGSLQGEGKGERRGASEEG